MKSKPKMLPISNPLSLYAIMQEHLDLLQQVVEADGEITPELDQALQLNADELQQKGISLGYLLKTIDYNIDVLDKEIDRLQALKKRAVSAKEFFKQRLSKAMQLFGIERLDGGNIKLSFRKSESVEIVEPYRIPEEFLVPQPPVASKQQIKEALKAGIEVPGARIVTKQNLQIK